MNRERNRQIFQETLAICRAGGYMTTMGRVNLPSMEDVLTASRFYVKPPMVNSFPARERTVVDVVKADCVEVTRELVEKGYHPIMLNMANRHTPGGGVLNGARAQEESLFRRSNLCVSLYQYDEYHAGLLGLPLGNGRYPMDRNTGGIYSGRVTFFRMGLHDGDKLVKKPFECAAVSVAAINHPDLDANGRLVDWAATATAEKIRTMLRIGLLNGHDAIVLGAWGCGAFCNPPGHMAEIFHSVLREAEFTNKFKVVRFAVIEDHNSNNSNFASFDREFNGAKAAVPATQLGTSETWSSRAMVRRMAVLAKKMHSRDTRPRKYTNAPYITHPANVVEMLKSWGYSADDDNDAVSLAIAWGHDLLEKTKVTLDDIVAAGFPESKRILGGIRHLTFDSSGTLTKDAYIRDIGEGAHPECLVVKIADFLCNAIDFCMVGDVSAKDYLKRGEPLFARIAECKGTEAIGKTLTCVRSKVAALRDPGFPAVLTAEMLKGFVTTERGCTHPRVGTIGGHHFIAKCGSWSDYSSDRHVHNEYVADNLLRAARLNVSLSREYTVDFSDGLGPQTIRLAVYDDKLLPIMQVWRGAGAALRAKIRAQVVAAYPVQALIAGIDTFTWDNVKVDADGNLWFVDNGASFNYRACGKKKGWFWDRCDVNDPSSGYLSLARHPHQTRLQEILGSVDSNELWAAAAKCHFRALVGRLPDKYRRRGFKEYAKALDAEAKERIAADETVKRHIHGIGDPVNTFYAEKVLGEGETDEVVQRKEMLKMERDKVKGMLWGLIVGDALGSPIQFSGKNAHPWITEMVPCPKFHLPAGYWTDDGSMAMCVMDSFVRKNGYDLADIGNTFVKWLKEGYLSSTDHAFDVGRATRRSVAWIEAGSLVNGSESSQGNGSIMRLAPSYLIARALNRPKAIHEVSDLTHASKTVRGVCDEFAAVLDEHLAGRRTTRGLGRETVRADVPNSGWCVESFAAALWAFNTTTTFEDGLVAAVNLGGDSDSIGAIFGQIAGAYYGFDAIPNRWVKGIKASDEVDNLIASFIAALERAETNSSL